VANEWTIRGSAVGNQREALEVLDMAARGIVKTHLRTENIENLTAIFQEMKVRPFPHEKSENIKAKSRLGISLRL
jgi:D-arabinose 1-dehydrogenase-like Zn-dependent alcohol dehydrogenase